MHRTSCRPATTPGFISETYFEKSDFPNSLPKYFRLIMAKQKLATKLSFLWYGKTIDDFQADKNLSNRKQKDSDRIRRMEMLLLTRGVPAAGSLMRTSTQ
jgi:hypothetical protein